MLAERLEEKREENFPAELLFFRAIISSSGGREILKGREKSYRSIIIYRSNVKLPCGLAMEVCLL
jgi:hypothetical protein